MTTNVTNPTAQAQIQYLEQVATTGVDPEQKAFAQGILAGIQGLPEAEIVDTLSEIFGIAPNSNMPADQLRREMDDTLALYDAIASGEIQLSDSYSNLTPEAAAMAIAKLAIEMSFQRQQEARDQAIASREMRVSIITGQANLMREEADSLRAQAGKQLLLGVVSGLVSIAGGVASGIGSMSQLNIQGAAIDQQAGDITLEQQQQIFHANEGWAAWGEASGQLAGGMSKGLDAWNGWVGTNAQADQKDLQARGKLLEAAAEYAGTEKETAEKIEQSNQQFANDMMDNLRRIQEAQNVKLAI